MDIDGDGALDLYVNNGGTNFIYRNDGQGVFTRVTNGPVAVNGFSVSWADMDNDGHPDFFTTAQNPNPLGYLFRQLSPGVFTRTTVPVGFFYGQSWADYDNDGFLDLLAGDSSQNVLWHNNGQGVLVAVRNTPINNLGCIAWADFDNDGDQDLLVAGHLGNASRLYRNDGNGVFTPIVNQQLTQRGTLATEAAWGDYDNDGLPDFCIPRNDSASPPQALPSALFHNLGNGIFEAVDQAPITTDTGFSIGYSWADYDNDGWLDLFVTEYGGLMNRLYHNNGNGTFSRVEFFPDDPGNCAGSMWADYDGDGFLDLFVAASGPGPIYPNDYLYHNNGNSNAWIDIKCVGTRSNRSAIGAKVRVKATIQGRTFWQLRQISSGSGWGGCPLDAHFGLGNATNVESLRIEWPSGTVQEFQNVGARQHLTITEPSRLVPAGASADHPQGLTLEGGRNMQYDIQASTNLTDWSPLNTITITNLDGRTLISDPSAPSGSRFYRAVLR